MCVGQQAGCEAAIHAVRKMFQDPKFEAVVFVDTSDALSNINRQATLHIKIKCLILARYV